MRESSLLEKKLGQKIRQRLEGSRRLFVAFPSVSPAILHPPLTLATPRFSLLPTASFSPLGCSAFFQSRRCNDSNLEVRTRHTRRQPTPISPLHRVTFSLPFSLPFPLPLLSLSIMTNDSEASFSCCISNARSRRASTCLKGGKDEEEEKGATVEGSRSGTETGGRESDAEVG